MLGYYSFFIVRYVPDLLREEFINIGVLIFDQSFTRPPLVKMTRDWTRLQSFAQDVDVETLQALEEDLTRTLAGDLEAEPFVDLIKESFSGNLQISHQRGRAAESMNGLAEELMALYVFPSMRKTLFAVASGT